MKRVTFLLLLLTFSSSFAIDGLALKPPMGWNGYDCGIGDSARVLAQANYMASKLKKYGWEYICIDDAWFEGTIPPGGPIIVDQYGRLVARTISAGSSRDFKPISDYIHSKGLKFGLWWFRGIPKTAYETNTPVKGTSYRAKDITDLSPNAQSPWLPQNYGLIFPHEGSQAYTESVVELAAQWGVDFLKIDDITYPYRPADIESYRKAIRKIGRPMILSLSPGNSMTTQQASHVSQYADMWRTTGDVNGNWDAIQGVFSALKEWAPFSGPGHWADGDMLPLGSSGGGMNREEQKTVMTLWCIARSPLIWGGDLTKNTSFHDSLMSNEEVIGVNQNSDSSRCIFDRNGQIGWFSNELGTPNHYLALFNQNSSVQNVGVTFAEMKLQAGESRKFRDLWAKQDVGLAVTQFSASIPAHGAKVFKVMPGATDIQHGRSTGNPISLSVRGNRLEVGNLAAGSPVSISVYTIRGEMVRAISVKSPGYAALIVDMSENRGGSMTSGRYLVRVRMCDQEVTRILAVAEPR